MIKKSIMNRRQLLAGLSMAGVPLEAQHNPESLYIPKAHLVEDRKLLHDFMDEFSFVDLELVSSAQTGSNSRSLDGIKS